MGSQKQNLVLTGHLPCRGVPGREQRERAESAGRSCPLICKNVEGYRPPLLASRAGSLSRVWISFLLFLLPPSPPLCLLMKHSLLLIIAKMPMFRQHVTVTPSGSWELRFTSISHSPGLCLLSIYFVPGSLLSTEDVTMNRADKRFLSGQRETPGIQTSCMLRVDRQKERRKYSRWCSISDRKLPHCEGTVEGRPEEALLRKNRLEEITGKVNKRTDRQGCLPGILPHDQPNVPSFPVSPP